MINILIINWLQLSDTAILESLGQFIKEQRMRQNKTQAGLAGEAGISRMALSFFENGENTSLLTFISLLRALNLLNSLDAFTIEQQISPLLLAKMEKAKRSRASGSKGQVRKTKSEW